MMDTTANTNVPATLTERPINRSVYDSLMQGGIAEWLADLLSRRVDTPVHINEVYPEDLSILPDPAAIPDMAKAVERIVRGIVSGEGIILAVDHDVDGTHSAAVLWAALVEHFGVPAERVQVVTSHRIREGYGITDAVVERILATDSTLVISADKGSSDEPRIRRLKEAGRDAVVTDHHEIPVEGPPASAYAVVNPVREDSNYDPYICGATVAWMVMAKVRSELLRRQYRPKIRSLSVLLDYLAVATVADCVSLRPDKSPVNRLLVRHGLSLINSGSRPCWRVFKEGRGRIGSEDLGFALAPPIAAAGRLDWPDIGLQFLVAKTDEEARQCWEVLTSENENRKKIEKTLRASALDQVGPMLGPDKKAIVLLLLDGHVGVHGITASRLVEKFGKPAAIFSPKGQGAKEDSTLDFADPQGRALTSGSFRGVEGLHIRDALQAVDDRYPGLMVGFGGHKGAAGATIAIEDFPRFAAAYEEAVAEQLAGQELTPTVLVDDELDPDMISFAMIDQLAGLEPWGRDFPAPIFTGRFKVTALKAIGDGSHLRMELGFSSGFVGAIWFSAIEPGQRPPFAVGAMIDVAYRLSDNTWRGNRSIQLQVVDARVSP